MSVENDTDVELDIEIEGEEDVDAADDDSNEPVSFSDKIEALDKKWADSQKSEDDAEDEDKSADKKDDKQAQAKADPKAADQKADPKYLSVDENKDKLVKFTQSGQEVEMTLQKVVELANKADVADKKLREAADATNKLDGFMDVLKDDPFKILAHKDMLGEEGAYQAATKWLAGIVRVQNMKPEEKARYLEQKELEQFRKEKESRERAEKNDTWNKTWDDNVPKIGDAIAVGFENLVIPLNEDTSDLVFDYLQAAIDEKPEIKEAIEKDAMGTIAKILPVIFPLVEKNYIKKVGTMLGTDNRDEIIAVFNKQIKKQGASKEKAKKVVDETSVPGVKKGKETGGTRKRKTDKARVNFREMTDRLINDAMGDMEDY